MSNKKAEAVKETFIPDVIFTHKAWAKTQYIIAHPHKLDNEITWFGVLDRTEEGHVVVEDVFIPEQEVTAVTTECEDRGIIMADAHAAGFNPMKTRAWFHLHPKGMATNPSTQDEDQTDNFIYKENWPYLLRGIFNNQGSINMCFIDMETKLKYTGLTVRQGLEPLFDVDKLDTAIKERVAVKKFVPYQAPQRITKTTGKNGRNGTTTLTKWCNKLQKMIPVTHTTPKKQKSDVNTYIRLQGLTNNIFNFVDPTEFLNYGCEAMLYSYQGNTNQGKTLLDYVIYENLKVTYEDLSNWRKQFAIKNDEYRLIMHELYEDIKVAKSNKVPFI